MIISDGHSSNRPTPFCKHTHPQISIMFSVNPVRTQVE
ncbi:hypothetical protein GPB2148_2283 [marine gamma proteobacterium HTCC2148]|nr:hypothetical protein GPB2148_2283 [marine gamma proteobacterium HTCC2148]